MPETPREPRTPRPCRCALEGPDSCGGPGWPSARERLQARGSGSTPARRIPAGRPGLGAAGGTHRAPWRGRPGAARCRRPGGRGSDAAGLTAAGTLLPLLPPLPPPPGLPRPLPARGGPAPSPPSAGPSLCPRPGPRAATWARGGAEARRRAPRARTPPAAGRGARGCGPAAASALPSAPAAQPDALAPTGPRGSEVSASSPPTDTHTSSFGNPDAAPPRRERLLGRDLKGDTEFTHSATSSFIPHLWNIYVPGTALGRFS